VKYQAVQDKFASESTRWMMIGACLLWICSIMIAWMQKILVY
jgi:hypothetical protein